MEIQKSKALESFCYNLCLAKKLSPAAFEDEPGICVPIDDNPLAKGIQGTGPVMFFRKLWQ